MTVMKSTLCRKETLSALTDKTEEDFWDMTVSYVSVNSLASLKVNYQGTDYKVNVSRETSTDEDGNDTETVTYKLDWLIWMKQHLQHSIIN